MSLLVALPVLVPLSATALGFALWRRPRAQQAVGVVGALALAAVGVALTVEVAGRGAVAVQVGDWPAPHGITLIADRLGAILVLLAGLVGSATAVYALVEVDVRQRANGFYPLMHLLLAGVCGAFVTGDLFNLYVWFEVMLIASFVLLVLAGGRERLEGGIKYVALNLVSSAMFLAATGAVYVVARTLNLAELAVRMPEIAETRPDLAFGIAALFLVSFGIKAGLFPLFFWLPASYHTPPAAVSALFAGLLTKVGVYALVRVFTLMFPGLGLAFDAILILAAATMAIGVLGAVAQGGIRRILGFHIVSQIGYIVVGLGLLASPSSEVRVAGLAATVLYVAHHILVKTNLYLVGGVVRRMRGVESLDRLGGLATAAPWLAALFLIPAGSLAGIPPLSGFWAKLAVIRAALEGGHGWVAAIALAAGVLTVVSMSKIWTGAFWGEVVPASGGAPGLPRGPRLALLVAPIVVLAALTVAIGLFPQPLVAYAEHAARDLLNPEAYLRALGGAR